MSFGDGGDWLKALPAPAYQTGTAQAEEGVFCADFTAPTPGQMAVQGGHRHACAGAVFLHVVTFSVSA
ncbi:MAG: hypothetical protein D6819_10340, partial [Gammaproteobacteria bacterium]